MDESMFLRALLEFFTKRPRSSGALALACAVVGVVLGSGLLPSPPSRGHLAGHCWLLASLSWALAAGLGYSSIKGLTERRRAAVTLQAGAERQQRSIFSAMAEGFVVQSKTGEIIDANPAAEAILGLSREQLLGRASMDPRWHAIHEDGTPFPGTEHPAMVTLRTGLPLRNQIMGVLIPGDGLRWISINSQPIGNDKESPASAVVTSFVDVTERKRAEDALREREAKLRGLYRMPHVGLVLTDIRCRYLEFNDAFRTITGYSDDELLHLDSRQMTPKQYEAVDVRQLELAKSTGRFGPYEKEYIRKDGSLVPLQLTGALFTASDGTQYLWTIVEDITERKRLERAVLEAADRERRRLGADLHDGLGQELTGISLMIGALAKSAKMSRAPGAEELARLEVQVGHAIGACRAVAHGLSPLSYAGGGLVGALQEMAHPQDGRQQEPEIRFEATPAAPLRLPPDVTDHLYRIAQEAVTNAQRHAKARRIDVTLSIQPASVRLEIRDDGVGPTSSTAENTGMGQKIMQFRADMIGARLSIEGRDTGGTLVAVECPQPP
jgi:PAS domain S-box-containing protein